MPMFSGITAEGGGYVRYWPLTDIGALRMSAFRGVGWTLLFATQKCRFVPGHRLARRKPFPDAGLH